MSLPGKKIEVNGLNLHFVDEGSGPAVLLLHGFPDSSSLWRHLIPVLLEEGFRVIAPDMRGFGESDKPEEIEAYQFSELASDMVSILQTLQIARAHVIGHDWGAVLGWVLAASCPPGRWNGWPRLWLATLTVFSITRTSNSIEYLPGYCIPGAIR